MLPSCPCYWQYCLFHFCLFSLGNFDFGVNISFNNSIDFIYTVGYATKNDAATNECYNEQILSTKSGGYNEHRCYNERGEILFIRESSIIVFTREILFMLFKFTCTLCKC